MAFDFSVFNDRSVSDGQGLDEAFVGWLVNEQAMDMALHFEKLWSYYRNEAQELSLSSFGNGQISETARPYRQRQEYGLPSRITGVNYGFYGGIMTGSSVEGIKRKEVVIENDIAWRIDTMVDFLFGKKIDITSRAAEPRRAEEIQQILQAVLEANGGAAYLQELSLLGSIYGFVDVILRWQEPFTESCVIDISDGQGKTPKDSAGATLRNFNAVLAKAREITLEAIDAPRSLPVLDESNYHKINYYIQHYRQQHNTLDESGGFITTVNHQGHQIRRRKETHNVEIIGPHYWQRYEGEELTAMGRNLLGIVPVVHIQNMPLPMCYEGQSDVEPLMPLQDELNTRLSDRASRITFQSFKMYLGKGIEGFEELMLVTGVSSDTLTVVRGYGGTTAEDLVDDQVINILGNAALEGADKPTARFTSRVRKGNYAQIFTAAVEVSGSDLAARQLGLADELDYQKPRLTP